VLPRRCRSSDVCRAALRMAGGDETEAAFLLTGPELDTVRPRRRMSVLV
jgi:hypothetical protein